MVKQIIIDGVVYDCVPARTEESLRKECIKRYGKNWENMYLDEDSVDWIIQEEETINNFAFSPKIFKDNGDWIIYNRNGIVYSPEGWAKKAENPIYSTGDIIHLRDKKCIIVRVSRDNCDYLYDCIPHIDLTKQDAYNRLSEGVATLNDIFNGVHNNLLISVYEKDLKNEKARKI